MRKYYRQQLQKIQQTRQVRTKSFTVSKNQSSVSYNHPEFYKFFLGAGNNSSLVRRVLKTRGKWIQATDSKQLFLNFRWQQSEKGYKYQNCIQNRIFKQSLNHFQYHEQLSNKQYLYKNLYQYCQNHKINVFSFIPITFVLNLIDSHYEQQQLTFIKFYNKLKSNKDIQTFNVRKRKSNPNHLIHITAKSEGNYCKYVFTDSFKANQNGNLWILKPTSYNRGNGVHVFKNLTQMQQLMNRYIIGVTPNQSKILKHEAQYNTKKSFRIRSTSYFTIRSNSFVVQKYLQRPLLYQGRKFDIRMWVLISHDLKVYLFKQGYLRTSSLSYKLQTNDQNIHLTNNAVQKYNENYSIYEDGNQLSFQYLKQLLKGQQKDFNYFMQRVAYMIKISCLSVRKKINKQQRSYCFQIFGYDFMIDQQFNPWLIQVNTNPCIQQSSHLLSNLLPRMLDNAFMLTIDQIFSVNKQKSNFYVQGYSNDENLWEFLIDIKKH